MKKKLIVSVLVLSGLFYFSKSEAQKIRLNYFLYSFGIFKTEVADERDNLLTYDGSKFQPFSFTFSFADNKWRHRFHIYYIRNELKPIESYGDYTYNYSSNRTGELTYDLQRKVDGLSNDYFRLYAGAGIYAFGATRERRSLNSLFSQEDKVISYDINRCSFQLVVNPEYSVKNHGFSLKLSAGILSSITRPDYYNPNFNSNNGKWYITSFGKHHNFMGCFDYFLNFSDRFAFNLEYRYFYYYYSFPYPLKVLNQNYLAGILFKF